MVILVVEGAAQCFSLSFERGSMRLVQVKMAQEAAVGTKEL
jgi:hypothetical protein